MPGSLDPAAGPAALHALTQAGPWDDTMRPYLVDPLDARGRLVRLGPALDLIIGAHDYPEPVARLLAEAVTAACALSGMLKYEGIFTFQAKGDGPVNMLVAGVTSDGGARGYAQFDPDKLAAELELFEREEADSNFSLVDQLAVRMLGSGHLAFTVDQGAHTQRYQGIVELYGLTLADCVLHYFRQSEQILTQLKLATLVETAPDGERRWRSGGLIIQRVPDETLDRETAENEEEWRRAASYAGSVTAAELLDPALDPDLLLYRLFHEEGCQAFPAVPLRRGCRCTDDRIVRVVESLSPEEVADMQDDGGLTLTCEFCGVDFRYQDGAVTRNPAKPS